MNRRGFLKGLAGCVGAVAATPFLVREAHADGVWDKVAADAVWDKPALDGALDKALSDGALDKEFYDGALDQLSSPLYWDAETQSWKRDQLNQAERDATPLGADNKPIVENIVWEKGPSQFDMGPTAEDITLTDEEIAVAMANWRARQWKDRPMTVDATSYPGVVLVNGVPAGMTYSADKWPIAE